jgi:branched-chain amino acid aminotransferase
MGLSQEKLTDRLFQTLQANQMRDHVHIRLMATRGIKSTPFQDPVVTISGPTIVIIPECEVLDPSLNDRGLRLYTVYTRRGYADVQDPKINSHSKLN